MNKKVVKFISILLLLVMVSGFVIGIVGYFM